MIAGQTQLLPWLDVLQDRVHHQETAAIAEIALTFALNEGAAVLTPVAIAWVLLQVLALRSIQVSDFLTNAIVSILISVRRWLMFKRYWQI